MGGDSNPGRQSWAESRLLNMKFPSVAVNNVIDLHNRFTFKFYFKLASIHRHSNSKFWYCCINVPGRGQLHRTMKHTDRRRALECAHKLESATRGNALTEIQARKILTEIYEIRNAGEKLPGSSAKDFFDLQSVLRNPGKRGT